MPISAGIRSYPPPPEGPVVWIAQFTDTTDLQAAYEKVTQRFSAEINSAQDEPPVIEVSINEDNIVRLKTGDALIYFGQSIWHFQYGDALGDRAGEAILTRHILGVQ